MNNKVRFHQSVFYTFLSTFIGSRFLGKATGILDLIRGFGVGLCGLGGTYGVGTNGFCNGTK